MTREDIIDKAINTYIEENITFCLTDILHDYKEHSYEYLEKYLRDFHAVFQKALWEQKNGRKGKIGYAGIYVLYSNLQKEQYELQLELYDETFYLDKNPVTGGISSHVFSIYFQDEWKKYLEYMEKHVIQVQKQEYIKFRCRLIHKYENISKAVIKMYLPYILNLKSYAMLDKSEEFNFVFGEYLGAIEKINGEEEV